MSVDEPELEDILEEALEAHLALLETAFSAVIVSFDSDKNRAQIAPVIRDRYVDADTEEVSYRLGPVISNVPFSRHASRTHGVLFPLVRGDLVYCAASSRSQDEFLTTGTHDNIPEDPRDHERTDAVIVGCIHPFSDPVGKGDGVNTVVYGPLVLLGDKTAADFVALASLVAANHAAIAAAITPMATAFNVAPAGTPMVSLGPGSVVPFAPSSVAATKVKAK